ncbi:MAG TPA: nuclear transport factor 2 family protein [Jatrophihabitans sp.]|nr:nuclear transport factor 2 family protein [Jatrophihabitans sp.]
MIVSVLDEISQLDEVVQRLAVTGVMASYAAGVDLRDWELVASCFAPDAYVHGTKMSAEFGTYFPFLCAELEKFERTVHFLGNQRCRLAADTAWLETYAVARHFWTDAGSPHQLTLSVRYRDDFRRAADGWVIARRLVELDWMDTSPPGPGLRWTVPKPTGIAGSERAE